MNWGVAPSPVQCLLQIPPCDAKRGSSESGSGLMPSYSWLCWWMMEESSQCQCQSQSESHGRLSRVVSGSIGKIPTGKALFLIPACGGRYDVHTLSRDGAFGGAPNGQWPMAKRPEEGLKKALNTAWTRLEAQKARRDRRVSMIPLVVRPSKCDPIDSTWSPRNQAEPASAPCPEQLFPLTSALCPLPPPFLSYSSFFTLHLALTRTCCPSWATTARFCPRVFRRCSSARWC